MSTQALSRIIEYPEDDGLPMSESMQQFEWITKLVSCLDAIFGEHADVLVAGDLLWYPVEGDNTTRVAPDAMVIFGRPKGYRGSYIQWREEGIAPQVVFEVLSPGNRFGEMARKFGFYDRFGVEEYYIINPESGTLEGWRRIDGTLTPIEIMEGWESPLLGIRFERSGNELRLIGPDGQPFVTPTKAIEHGKAADKRAEKEHKRADREHKRAEKERKRAELALQRADQEHQRADLEHQRAEKERQRAEEERQRADRLMEKLRAQGIDPDA